VIDLPFSEVSKPDVGGTPPLADGQVQWCEMPKLVVGIAENSLERWICGRVAQILIEYSEPG
jgi:hypothetical protein